MGKCSEGQCKKRATQLHPTPLCDRHWAKKYSKQYSTIAAAELGLSNPLIPYGQFLKWLISKRGKKDETTVSKSEGKKATTVGSRPSYNQRIENG
jgi:hypothetical protein